MTLKERLLECIQKYAQANSDVKNAVQDTIDIITREDIVPFEDYIEDAIKTNSWKGDRMLDRMHGAIGVATEAGELLDVYKKALYYNRIPDEVNIKEEIGDLLWYIAILIKTHNLNPSDVMRTNINKLKARYPNLEFNSVHAVERDLDKERSILERRNGDGC